MIEIDVRLVASVTGADAGELDRWWLDVRIGRKLRTRDALAFWHTPYTSGWAS